MRKQWFLASCLRLGNVDIRTYCGVYSAYCGAYVPIVARIVQPVEQSILDKE